MLHPELVVEIGFLVEDASVVLVLGGSVELAVSWDHVDGGVPEVVDSELLLVWLVVIEFVASVTDIVDPDEAVVSVELVVVRPSVEIELEAALVLLAVPVYLSVEASEVVLIVLAEDSEAVLSGLVISVGLGLNSEVDHVSLASERSATNNTLHSGAGKVEAVVSALLEGSEVDEVDKRACVGSEVGADQVEEAVGFELMLDGVTEVDDVPEVGVEFLGAPVFSVVDTLLPLSSDVAVDIGIAVGVVCWEVIVDSVVVKLLVDSEGDVGVVVLVAVPDSLVEKLGVDSESDDVDLVARLVLSVVSVDSVGGVVLPDTDMEIVSADVVDPVLPTLLLKIETLDEDVAEVMVVLRSGDVDSVVEIESLDVKVEEGIVGELEIVVPGWVGLELAAPDVDTLG
ncbi:unnamed protein product, partial [Mesorhabditis spiculigera]